MPFKTPSKTSEYIRGLVKLPSATILQEILDYADSLTIPSLLPETAIFLYQMTALQKPIKILEIGTGAGYSLHTMLYANDKSMVHSVDINETNISIAKRFLQKSGFSDRVRFYLGDAGDILPSIDAKYDLIFLDGPKARYLDYLPFIKRNLNIGGMLICDNVLFDGMVSGEAEMDHKKNGIVKRIDMFLNCLCNDIDFTTSILPVGDGVSLSIKQL